MTRLKLLLFLVMVFSGCSNDNDSVQVKPLKLDFQGRNLICEAEVKNNMLHGWVKCFHDTTNVVFLKDFYQYGKLNGERKEYYSDGKMLKKIGRFKDDKVVGKWKYYYPNGGLESLRIYAEDSDNAIYAKNYKDNGDLYSTFYPIKIESKNKEIHLSDSIEIVISLEASEYDSFSIGCYFDLDGNIDTHEDSLLSKSATLEYKFIPRDTGFQKLDGLLIEVDDKGEYGGQCPFEFEYFVKS